MTNRQKFLQQIKERDMLECDRRMTLIEKETSTNSLVRMMTGGMTKSYYYSISITKEFNSFIRQCKRQPDSYCGDDLQRWINSEFGGFKNATEE